MKIEEIHVLVAHVEACKFDNEVAHIHEDDLHVSVLKAIAAGAPDAPSLAAAALKTTDIDFARWYA